MSEFLISFIQEISAQEPSQQQATCKSLSKTVALLNLSLDAIKSLLNKGGLETYLALLILNEMHELKNFNEISEVVLREDMKKELVEVLFQAFPAEFVEKYLQRVHEKPKEIMQKIMSVIEEIGPSMEIDIKQLIVDTLENVKNSIRDNRYTRGDLYEDYSDVSCPHYMILLPYHRTSAIILSSFPEEFLKSNIETVLANIKPIPGYSGELMPYTHLIFRTPDLFSNPSLWNTIEKDLLHLDAYIRKQASIMLKQYIKSTSQSSSEWDTFWELYDVLENYARHLVEGLWPRISALMNWDRKYLALLYERAVQHENISVRRYIAKHYMTSITDKSEFAVKELVSFLSDPQLYSDAPTLTQRSKFGTYIPIFYKKFFSDLEEGLFIKYARIFILEISQKVKFQITFRYFVDAILENKLNKAINDETIQAIIDMTDGQMPQQPPSQRNTAFKMALSFIEVDSNEYGLIKLRLAAKIPVIPKVINLNPEESKQWISEALTISYDIKPKIIFSPKELGLLIKFSKITNEELKDFLSPYFTAISGVYRNIYINKNVALSWIQDVASVFTYIALDPSIQSQFSIFFEGILEEIISYAMTLIEDSDALKILISSLEVFLKILGERCIGKIRNHSEHILRYIQSAENVALYSYLSYLKLFLGSIIKTDEATLLANKTAEIVILLKEREKCQNRDFLANVSVLKWEIIGLCVSIIEDKSYLIGPAVELVDFCHQQTMETLFSILKTSFLPAAIQANNCNFYLVLQIEEIYEKCWALVLEGKHDAPIGIAVKFLSFAFNESSILSPLNDTYLPKLFKKVIEKGHERWGFTRALLNECYPIFIAHSSRVLPYTSSILELSLYQEIRGDDSEFALMNSFALINSPKPHCKIEEIAEQGQYIRMLTLAFIDKISYEEEFSYKIVKECFAGLSGLSKQRGELPNSELYKQKIRLGQLACVLSSWIIAKGDQKLIKESVQKCVEIISIPHVHVIRQYIERFLISLLLVYPQYTDITLPVLDDYNLKPQVASSTIVVLGAVMVFLDSEPIREQIFNKVLPFMICNTAHIRRASHYIIYKLLEKYPNYSTKSPMFPFLFKNKECIKMQQRFENLLEGFNQLKECGISLIMKGYIDDADELVHDSLVNLIDETVKNTRDDEFYGEEGLASGDHYWRLKAAELPLEHKIEANFQRKVEDTQALVEMRTMKGIQKRHELIIIASLLDKLPNLAGLTRTGEVFNLQLLTVPNKNMVNEAEYKNMAVTADRWLPIIEVTEENLPVYLNLCRHNQYRILGLEQTANSIPINQYEFPSKCVLVLGKEKEGIPGNILELVDHCVEIPQFGMVRSLNVHVSGSICIWEYMKQNYIK